MCVYIHTKLAQTFPRLWVDVCVTKGKGTSYLLQFYKDERFCDIALCVEGCRFTAHRIVLAASSLYFERMFSNGMAEAQAPEVDD